MRTVEIQGGISRDHIVTVGCQPAYHQPGGPGVYAALGAARGAEVVDASTGTTTRVRLRAKFPARDTDIRDLLVAAEVDVTACTDGTAPSLWILNAPEGRRIVATSTRAHELDESDTVTTDDEPGTTATDTDVLLRSAPGTGLDRAARPPTVLVDPDQRAIADHGWEYLTNLAATTDVYLPSRVQLRQLDREVRRAAEEMRRRTGRSVVARLDVEGSLVLPAAGGAWRIRGGEVNVVDTTGAGDSHAGALAATLTDPTDPRALLDATVVATAIVAHTLAGTGPSTLTGGATIGPTELSAIRIHEED